MSQPILHQFTDSMVKGDAITDHALLLQQWLRQWGFISDIYTLNVGPKMETAVHPITSYTPNPSETHLIYHHSIGSDMADILITQFPALRHLMIYHNITPPEFFSRLEVALIAQLERGRHQLHQLKAQTDLAIGVSAYNVNELHQYGFTQTGVLPLPLDPSQYDHPFNHDLQAQFANKGPILLFLGRIVPNKCQGDLIKLLYCYRQIQADAQLIIVGTPWLAPYVTWMTELAHSLDIADAIHFPGHVSFADMTSYYQIADLYVSMSEHEGLGKPLLESMHLGTPVLAYAAAAIPDTVGQGGILFHEKSYPALAELVDLIIHDPALNQRLISNGHTRAQQFFPDAIQKTFQTYLTDLLNWQP